MKTKLYVTENRLPSVRALPHLRMKHNYHIGCTCYEKGHEGTPLFCMDAGADCDLPLWKCIAIIGGGALAVHCLCRAVRRVRGALHDSCVRREARAEADEKYKRRETKKEARMHAQA